MPVKKKGTKKTQTLTKEKALQVLREYAEIEKELIVLNRRIQKMRVEFQRRSDEFDIQQTLEHLTKLSA